MRHSKAQRVHVKVKVRRNCSQSSVSHKDDENAKISAQGLQCVINVLWYEPYHCYYRAKQVKLLKLWDEIGLPHEKAKQEYGREL
jgi:hypothetical protein